MDCEKESIENEVNIEVWTSYRYIYNLLLRKLSSKEKYNQYDIALNDV